MKTSFIRFLFILLAGPCITFPSLGQSDANKLNVVTTAVPFLRISPDARAGGMGDVGVASKPDANSPFWNLAKTIYSPEKTALGVTYTPWLKDLGLNDVYLASLAGYHKLDEDQAVAVALRYFSLGNIQFTDFSGNELNSFRPREFSIEAGYSRRLSNKLSAGVALKMINSNLAGGFASNGVQYKTGKAVAADLSVYHTGLNDDGAGWTWGVVFSNLGSKISYTSDAQQKDYIPANLGLGIARHWDFKESGKLSVELDANKLLVPTPPTPVENDTTGQNEALLADYRTKSVISSWFSSFGDSGGFGEEVKEVQVSIGAEYTYNDQFSFRAGYFYENKFKGNRKYFTVGLGLKYNVFGLNFSYLVPSGSGVNRNPLSNTIRFGLTFDISGEANAGASNSTATPEE